ncbi:MAG: polyphosphate kinase 1 [bacterium]|nr:polyphosphate kinase 1 [bacterium]
MSLADYTPGTGAAQSSPASESVPASGSIYVNREMSWLAFNWRVLEEGQSAHNPLLERLNFLAITCSNLDEFFMKRVGGLKRQLAAGVSGLSIDGLTPQEQLALIRADVLKMIEAQDRLLRDVLTPELYEAGLRVVGWADLKPGQQAALSDYYSRMIAPILTPLGVGPGQPFPFISNLSLSLAVMVQAPGENHPRFARVKIPTNRPRFIQVPGEMVFVPLEEIIARNLQQLFVGMEIVETAPFRVTRNADILRNEEEADDLLETIEEELRNRRFAPVVRLETLVTISDELQEWLLSELDLDAEQDLYQSQTLLGRRNLSQLAGLNLPHLHYKPYSPVSHPRLQRIENSENGNDIFSVLRKGDVLVHHPFQSFATSVLGLLRAAARDPQVLAIKQTLYRTAANSPIVAALLEAVENGKEVNVQVEIKARFDEANNIEWVRTLERAGAHVSYGFVGLKTHCKTMLIVRDEPEGIRRYAHIGTGNYHTGTARLYTDLGLLTTDPMVCQDVADLFNYLTGHSNFVDYRKLLVAPVNMRQRFLEMIRREIRLSTPDNPGRILAKMNQLEDPEIIQALYEASQAGVQIDAIVRGFCCLRPGVPGLSENIRIMSIIGRFLEHSRIFYFQNGGEPEYYIGSADWMSRNLSNRVEAVTPIESPALQKELDFIMKTCFADQRQAWDLKADGAYQRRHPRRGKGSQRIFMDRAAGALQKE